MHLRINLNINTLIAVVAKLAINYINTKMNPKEVPNTRNISPNYNQNLLPNISINMNESKMDIDSKQNSPMNSNHNPNNLVQLSQLNDPNDEYIYSPRRTMYETRSSKKSNNFPNKNIKSVSNKNEISEDFSTNEISIDINTEKNENSPHKLNNTTQISF